jgi:hypothetical protein
MKKVFLLFLLPLSLGLMGMKSRFPGDGYPDPDAFGVSGHGPALNYTDNGDGTFTDDVTKFIWEIKTDDGSVHDVDNEYTWTDTTNGDNTDPDGTLFTEFLYALNNTCDGEGITDCESKKDCAKGENCGFTGHKDWCIPNIKVLQTIVDYTTFNSASSVPGLISTSPYWSSTTFAYDTDSAWIVISATGDVFADAKSSLYRARAVRPCM